MRITRHVLLHGLRAAAVREYECRHAEAQARGEDALNRLLAKLDDMAKRMRGAPGWREPTAEESAVNLREVEAWFARVTQPGAWWRRQSPLPLAGTRGLRESRRDPFGRRR